MNNTHFFESYNYQIPLKPYKYWISLLSQSFYVVAVAAITDAVITMAVAMTAAGSSSFFCSAAEIMDVAATTAVKKIRRKGRGYFLCPFCRCFFAASCFFFFSSRHFRSIS